MNESIVGSSVVLGICFGAATGGKLIQYGRRFTLIIAALIGIVGVSINLVQNFILLVVGRVIYGVSAGFMAVAAPRFLEEYVPPHIYKVMSTFFTAAMPFGTFLALLGGLILPPDDSTKAVLVAD